MNKFREQLLHDPNSSFSTQSSQDEKLNEVKPSTKFYHQTIYVAPANDTSSKIEDILPEDGN